jgi:HK97 family phage major capsid protein
MENNLTPEQVVEKINGLFSEKFATIPTKDEVAQLKSELDNFKSIEVKNSEMEKAIAKMEGRIEAMSEKAVDAPKAKGAKTLKEALVKTYSDNVKAITDSIEKGNRITLDVKTDTTIDGDYTGNVALSVLEPGVNRIARPIRRIREISNVGTTTSKFVTYIQQTKQVKPTGEGTLWVNEAGAKFNGEVKYEEVSEEVKKVAAYIKVSKEMLADLSFVRSEINTELMEAIEQTIDNSLINGAGGVDLNGLLAVAPAFSAGTFAGTIPGANISDLIRIAKAQIQAANFEPTHVVLNPEDVAKIELTKTSSGEYTYPAFWDANMMLAGLTVVSSNNITAGTLVVGDFTKFNIKFREDMNMSVGYENDDFTRNMVTILCEARLVAYIKGNDVDAFVQSDIATDIALIND